MDHGDRLGRYEIVRVLGEGGQGVVYEAVLHGPAGFRKPVALKVLKGAGEGLVREARLGGVLHHRNLVDTYALEQVDGTWVCAMELVGGGSLAERIPLSPAAAVDAVIQACAGLAWAWTEIGLIHLDLKPENLLIDGSVVKVADLGIARAHGFAGDYRIGTPAFMAPEQRSGGAVDPRADVYALGLVLIALVTGYPHRDPDAVPDLAEVLARCLATDPNGRYAGPAALAEALRRVEVDGAGLTVGGPRASPQATTGSGETSLWTFDQVEPRPRANLPAELDAFVGRREEREALGRALREPGLVLLKGPGGVGKTRLALQAARRWHQATGNEAWWCDLSAARDVASALVSVADALEVPIADASGDAARDQLGTVLDGRGDVLLLLDNCEQIDGLESVVARWRVAAPQARLLLTSRRALPDLAVDELLEVGPLTASDARDLLVNRAPGVDADHPALAELVHRLDGLPLALELGAARLALLGPERLLARLDERLRLLARKGADRHATLRATLDASYELLDPGAQLALARLSVFRGGFTAEAAEAVAGEAGGAWILDRIQELLDHSLLTARPSPRGPRFAMLESVRVHAAEHLRPHDPAPERHTAWFAAMGSRAAIEALDHHGGTEKLHGLLAERADLEAACRRALDRRDGAAALAAARALWQVLELRGPAQDLMPLIDRVLALELDPRTHAEALEARAKVLRQAGRNTEALELLVQAGAVARELGDLAWEGLLLTAQGVVQRRLGEIERTLDDHQRALDMLRAAGHRRGEGDALANLAAARIYTGDLTGSREQMEAALAIHREVGNARSEAVALGNLAILDTRNGDPAAAERAYQQALTLHRALGDKRFEALALANLTVLHLDLGRLDRALATSQQALAMHVEVGSSHQEAITRANFASLLAGAGEIEEAHAQFDRAIAMHQAAANPHGLGVARTYLSELLRMEGRRDEARAQLELALEDLGRSGDRTWLAIAHCRLAVLASEAGDHHAAIATLVEQLPVLEGLLTQAWGQFLVELALARSAVGEDEAAQNDLDVAERLFTERSSRRDQLTTLCARVRIDVRAGRHDAARRGLAVARRMATELVVAGPQVQRTVALAAMAVEGSAPTRG